jgi:hypothetical protein
MGVLAIYALVTNPLLLIAIGFMCGGFVAINKWGTFSVLPRFTTVKTNEVICSPRTLASWRSNSNVSNLLPDTTSGILMTFHRQKHLYTGLFVVG